MLCAKIQRAPRQLRRLRLGLQTRAGHGPDGAHTKRCACPAVEKFCWASSADPPTLHALLLEMGNQCRKTTHAAHFRGSTLQCFRTSACVPSRWKVLSGEFRRRPTELVIKLCESDHVGRRGLSEPREDFSRLPTYAFHGCFRRDSAAVSAAISAALAHIIFSTAYSTTVNRCTISC